VIATNEVYKCKVTKVTAAAPGVLRLNANCDDVSDGKTKSVITLRRARSTTNLSSSAGAAIKDRDLPIAVKATTASRARRVIDVGSKKAK
jgi:hypothetical protein